MVALEGATGLSSDSGRKRETQRAEPALSPAGQKPPASRAGRSGCGRCEGNHSEVFSTAPATGPAATKGSTGSGARPTSASVRTHAGAPWKESRNGSGAGATPCNVSGGSEQDRRADEPYVLIRNHSTAYIRPVERKDDSRVALGQRESAATQARGNRRALRALSPAPAGSRTGHGEIAGALRAVIARSRLSS
jgi:hypothetical protein